MTKAAQLDFFRPTETQLDLLADLPPPAPKVYLPDPADIRAKAEALLATARAADELPWSMREALFHRTVFPQMCNWLPADEAAALRAAFAAELARLGLD